MGRSQADHGALARGMQGVRRFDADGAVRVDDLFGFLVDAANGLQGRVVVQAVALEEAAR